MGPTVLKLVLRNFRSYQALSLNFNSRFVVFYGRNGSGKTNILEAISLFSSSKGLRKATMQDFVNFKTKSALWSTDLVISKNGYKTFLSTTAINGRRVAKIDGDTASSLSSLEEFLWLLWVTPGMNNLFIEARSERRHFFDHLVSGFSPHYKVQLKKVTALQKERLGVLSFRRDENWLNILEQQIAEESLTITKTRMDFLKLLHATFKEYESDFLRPRVRILGAIENIVENHSEENAILEIADALKSSRQDDFEKQTTNFSVHKTSWLAYHPKNQFEAENCSTGENKAFLISLILAVTRIYQKTKRGAPVLLLDDLMMYLDNTRRSALMRELIELNVQTFFTGTEDYLFRDMFKLSQMYHVENSICNLGN